MQNYVPKCCPIQNMKKAKKLSVFGKNDSHLLPNFLQTHIFLSFDPLSRTYN